MPLDAPAPHAPSYYAATAAPAPSRPRLEGEATADVCVVGAGFTGIAAALELAERGRSVIVLEAARVGWGASGRNGGQIVNGYSRGLDTIERRHGAGAAAALGTMAFEGGDIIRDRVARHGIACDLRAGNVFAAFTARQMRGLEEERRVWRRFGHDHFVLVDRARLRDHARTDRYVGGLVDSRGGHVHPLNLVLGEAAAAEAWGARIHEGSAAVAIDTETPSVRTTHGLVRARTVLVCGNAYLGPVLPAIGDKVLPVSSQVIATEPLGAARATALLPSDMAIEDCNFVLDYYRRSADHRLIYGGGANYTGREPADVAAAIRPRMLRTFPELADVRIDHAWAGNLAITLTRIPHAGWLNERVLFAHGYSGHGVSTTHLMGRLLAEAVTGETDRLRAFASLPYMPFPGGRRLRVPLTIAGVSYYAFRDWLGR